MTDLSTMRRETLGLSHTVTAFFDDRHSASRAIDALVAAGIPHRDISLVAGHAGPDAPREVHGFWERLKDFFLPDEDRYSYAEGDSAAAATS